MRIGYLQFRPEFGAVESNLRRARELLGEEVCIVGNLDDMEVLDKRPFEDIWAAAERLMQALGKRGRVLSGTASGIYGVQAAENFLMLARKVGRLG